MVPGGGREISMSFFAEPRVVTSPAECFFYHTMELPGIGVVQGDWDLRDCFDDYIGRVDLKQKRVLDIGAASGFLTFEAEKRGAEVVSFDIADASTQSVLPFSKKLRYTNFKEWVSQQNRSYEPMRNAYWLAHRLYGSRAKVYYGDIGDLPEELGKFDVVLVGSVTEHLGDQIAALTSISRLAADTIVINSPIIDVPEKIAYFLPSANRPEQDYTWWVYSVGIYREVFGMLGFGIESILPVSCLHMHGGQQTRSALVARRVVPGENAADAMRKTYTTMDFLRDQAAYQDQAAYNASSQGLQAITGKFAHELELAAARAKLAALENLGPTTLAVAAKWRRMADKHPKAAGLLKPIARSLGRFVP
jgi:SAM-dependent methyltransferase